MFNHRAPDFKVGGQVFMPGETYTDAGTIATVANIRSVDASHNRITTDDGREFLTGPHHWSGSCPRPVEPRKDARHGTE